MASRELSILVKAKGAIQAARDIGKVDSSVGRLSSHARRGVASAAGNLTRLGVVAAGGIALAVRGGLASLVELENATVSVDGAIKQMGLAGKLTGAQVAGWANEIETAVGAAFDDKEITQAATTLLRFGKVTPQNLKPALVVMTDLATKTGSVDSAASLLAKALADPEKAAGKLARSGVILTKAQQKQIKAMVEAGDAAGAQAFLLKELAKVTGGAALASQGPYARAMATLSDVSEDARRALAEGFLPVLGRVATVLSEKLADPAVMEEIRAFGRNLAGAFDKLLEIGGRLPWAQIGDSFKIAGAGAKAVFDAFAGLPPWIQTAVLTGWGLNKLSGGALTGLLGDAVKIAFTQFAGRGATPANPLYVSDIAGGLGKGAGGAAGSSALALGAAALLPGVTAAVTGILADKFNADPEREKRGIGEMKISTGLDLNAISNLFVAADLFRKGVDEFNNPTKAAGSPSDREGMRTTALADQKRATEKVATRVETMKGAVVSATRQGDNAIVSTLRSINLSNNITIPITVLSGIPGRQTVRVAQTGTTLNRYAGKPVPI